MPKLPVLTAAEIVTVLEKRGFVLDRSKGSHRIYLNAETHRRITVPFHRKDLPKGTLSNILREAGLSADELKDLL